MILYFVAVLILTYGVLRMFTAVLGNNKTHDRIGTLINVFFYVAAVFLPFNYIVGVVLFGLGVLFMLSISFEASILMRLLATFATFAFLIVVRVGLSFANQHIEGIVLFILAALVFFAISSFAVDIRVHIDNKSRRKHVQNMQEKIEEEKIKMASKYRLEANGLKNYTTQHLENTLKLLDLYKLADVEASIKDLIARNRT